MSLYLQSTSKNQLLPLHKTCHSLYSVRGSILGISKQITKLKKEFHTIKKKYGAYYVTHNRRGLSNEIRYLYLILGFLRNKPYQSIERTTRPDNKININVLNMYLQQYLRTGHMFGVTYLEQSKELLTLWISFDAKGQFKYVK